MYNYIYELNHILLVYSQSYFLIFVYPTWHSTPTQCSLIAINSFKPSHFPLKFTLAVYFTLAIYLISDIYQGVA